MSNVKNRVAHPEMHPPDADAIQIKAASIQVQSMIPKFNKEIIHHTLTADNTQYQLEQYYDTIVATMKGYEMTIRTRQELDPSSMT